MNFMNILQDYYSLLDYEIFCVCNLGSKPTPEQLQVAKSYEDYNFLVVLMSRQAGKTWTVASKTLHYALTHPNKKILVFAPAKDQAVDILFGRIKTWIESKTFLMDLVKNDGFGKKRLFVDYVEFSNNTSIRCLSASEKSNIVGFTGDVVILDECQNISDLVVYQRIEPMLGSISNPKYIKIGCIAQDSLVLTDKGYEQIGKIDKGIEEHNRVLIGKDDIKVSTHMVSNPKFKVLTLETKSGYKITATPNHKIFDGKDWKMICDYKTNNKIPIKVTTNSKVDFDITYVSSDEYFIDMIMVKLLDTGNFCVKKKIRGKFYIFPVYIGDNIVYDKVRKITWSEAETSDFCLDGDHSYIANGFIVHNTPRGQNQFYESWKEGKAGKIWHVEEYPWQKCTRLNPKLIEQFKRTNPYFKTEYELEWMNNITSFFTRQELEDAFMEYDLGYYEDMFKEGRGNRVFGEVYCGIDWGSVKDRTAVWFLGNEGGKIKTLGVYEMMGNYREQIKDIIALLKIYNPLVTYIDATGSTTRSFGDMLEGIGFVIEGIQMSNKFKATELYDNLKRIVSYRLLELPKKEEILRQFYELELHQSTTATTFNRVQAPSNGHDDHTDACSLACLGFRDMVEDITSRMAYLDNKIDKDLANDPFLDSFVSYNYRNDPESSPGDKYYYKSGIIDLMGD